MKRKVIKNLVDKVIAKWKEDDEDWDNSRIEEDRMSLNSSRGRRALSRLGSSSSVIIAPESLRNKCQTLIKASIELCVHIWDPCLLFDELFPIFENV